MELLTGGSAGTMKLKVYDTKNNFICDIDNDKALFGSYPIDDGMRIHVIDNFALVKDFDAADAAERYENLLIFFYNNTHLLFTCSKFLEKKLICRVYFWINIIYIVICLILDSVYQKRNMRKKVTH